jgi:hypothetical protein
MAESRRYRRDVISKIFAAGYPKRLGRQRFG